MGLLWLWLFFLHEMRSYERCLSIEVGGFTLTGRRVCGRARVLSQRPVEGFSLPQKKDRQTVRSVGADVVRRRADSVYNVKVNGILLN